MRVYPCTHVPYPNLHLAGSGQRPWMPKICGSLSRIASTNTFCPPPSSSLTNFFAFLIALRTMNSSSQMSTSRTNNLGEHCCFCVGPHRLPPIIASDTYPRDVWWVICHNYQRISTGWSFRATWRALVFVRLWKCLHPMPVYSCSSSSSSETSASISVRSPLWKFYLLLV